MAILTYTYQFSTATTEPPTGSQLRLDADVLTGAQKVWVRYLTADGVDAFFALMSSKAGWTIWIQDKDDHTRGARYTQTGLPIDKGGYIELPVEIDVDNAPLAAQQVILGLVSPVDSVQPQPEPPPSGGTTTGASSLLRSLLSGRHLPVGGHWSVVTVTPPNDDDVLTVDELKERARILPGDEESDALLKSYISAARQQVEHDTGLALVTQTLAAGYDRIDASGIYLVPRPPLQDVTDILYMDADGGSTPLQPDAVLSQLDRVSFPGRITFASTAFAGLASPAQTQCLGLVYTAGFTKDTLPATLKFAVGLLAAHFLTTGRDLVTVGDRASIVMPYGYEDAIATHRLVTVI